MIKPKSKIVYFLLSSILFITLIAYYKILNIPTTIFVREGHSLKSNNILRLIEEDNIQASSGEKSYDKNVDISLLGLLKIKSVGVTAISNDLSVYPGGQPVGVKLNTKGVLVVGLSDIETDKGKMSSPAAFGGIEIGDSIIKINGEQVTSSENAGNLINNNDDKQISITVERKDRKLEKKIKPIKASDGKYKIGLWIRDSTSGIGTLTFYDDKNEVFAALGHPITDIDTGKMLNIDTGKIVPSSIIAVRKGVKGTPGELKGIFTNENMLLGNINKNSQCGIFGKSKVCLKNKYDKKMKVALRSEIKEGPAQILTTIDGNEPQMYNISIDKLLPQNEPGPKSMVIKITDERLLKKTGGIVQGMSGSPIIQNNKIVGAVTHVLINKPDTGYGIYIEWMLKDANVTK